MRLSFLCLPSSQSPPGRKTVDGFNIYKEDELGIFTTGGGVHLIQSLLALFSESLVQTLRFVRLIANRVVQDGNRRRFTPISRSISTESLSFRKSGTFAGTTCRRSIVSCGA